MQIQGVFTHGLIWNVCFRTWCIFSLSLVILGKYELGDHAWICTKIIGSRSPGQFSQFKRNFGVVWLFDPMDKKSGVVWLSDPTVQQTNFHRNSLWEIYVNNVRLSGRAQQLLQYTVKNQIVPFHLRMLYSCIARMLS